MKKHLLIFLCLPLLFCGCPANTKKAENNISIKRDSLSVEFRGMDGAILGEISRDSIPGIWQELLPVYKMPVDTDLKNYQQPQPGTYTFVNNAVKFIPDTPFIKGQKYYVRCYHFDEGKSIWDIIKNKRTLGRQPYTDLEW